MAKSSIEHAARWLGKQLQEIEESDLADSLKNHWADFFRGLHMAASDLESVGSPDNPPTPGSIHAELISAGSRKRQTSNVLVSILGGKVKPKDDAPKDDAPKGENGDAPKDEAPKDEAPKDEAPKDEAPKDEAPVPAAAADAF